MKETFLKLMWKISRKIKCPSHWFIFFPERLKIEELEKLLANFHDKTEYKKMLTQASNQVLASK